jgi:hypothetical protein
MTLKSIPIDDADVGQLRAFATTVLGLELGGRENIPTLRAKIAEANWTRDVITVTEGGAAPPSSPSGSHYLTTRVNAKGETEVKIRLHAQDRPGGDEPLPVSVNGLAFYIPRGEPCFVPEKYIEVLKNAQEDVYESYAGGMGGLGEARRVPSYPFSYEA